MNCPLFRKICVETIDDLHNNFSRLDARYQYILHIDCPFEIKEQIEDILKDLDIVLTYKITTKSIKQDVENQEQEVKIESNLDVMKSFKDFLNTGVELRYPMNLYNEVLDTEQQKIKQEIANKNLDVSSNLQNMLF